MVKVGGSRLGSADDRRALVERLGGLPGRLVLVHGGGGAITRWQERLGVPVRWIDGLRVTRGEGLEIASMVLSGWVNKRLVAACLDGGLPAVGLSGEDGGLILARVRDGGRLGAVGRVDGVRTGVLEALLSKGFVPVISPMARGQDGAALNVNADEAAGALAGALDADRLLLVSDVRGVLRSGEVVPVLDADVVTGSRLPGWVAGGMTVKVRAGAAAAGEGMEVRIGDLGLLDGPSAGTSVVTGARAGKGGG